MNGLIHLGRIVSFVVAGTYLIVHGHPWIGVFLLACAPTSSD